MAEMIGVSLSYGVAGNAWLRAFEVPVGTTIGEAIELSGVLQAYPEINLASQPVGIYAKKKPLETVLQARDRIEIYRPLVADPKDSRRKRAAKKAASA